MLITIADGEMVIHYGMNDGAEVFAKLTSDVMTTIVEGRMTFQRAFMAGDMTAKGNFKTLRMLDQIFQF